MDYSVVPKIHINKKNWRKVGAFLYNDVLDALYFESPWPFPVQLMISHGLTQCLVTPGFLKLPFILKGWINLDILLREIDLLKLVLEGKILMHASCVTNLTPYVSDSAELIVGFPNSGKTYQTYKNVSLGGELISEEYTIIYKSEYGNWWAKPYKPIMRTCFSQSTLDACGMKLGLKEKLTLMFTTIRAKLMPFMFEAVIWKDIKASGIEDKIDKIVYGSTGVEIKDWKTFAILCENEFPFMASEFLQAYAVATGFDLIGLQNKQRLLIEEFVRAVYPDPKS